MIPAEPEGTRQPAETPDTQGVTTIPAEPQPAPQPDATQKTANDEAKDGKSQPEMPQNAGQNAVSGKTDDDAPQEDEFIIEFSGDVGGAQDDAGGNAGEDRRQDSYDLEDEYYDLDGF